MAEIHKGYAMALFAISEESKSSDEICEGLNDLVKLFDEYPEYRELLSSPALNKSERLKLVSEAIGEHFHKDLTSFVLILCEKGHIRELEGCAKEYEELYKEASRISTAYVRSAIPLTESEKATLKQRLELVSKRSVTLNCRVDGSLLGGIVAEIDGKIYDGSLKRRFDEIKKVMNR